MLLEKVILFCFSGNSYRTLVYLKYCFKGLAFPPGKT